jgi:hypothetical protein
MTRPAAALAALLALSLAPAAHADHVVWFAPAGAKLSGQGAFTTPGVPEAIRISHTGGGGPQFGGVVIPLSLGTDVTVDSILICYKTVPQDPTSSSISTVTLRTMTVPTGAVQIFQITATRQNTAGGCDAINVADQQLTGAPVVTIEYVLGPLTYLEIGAIGIKVKTPTVSVGQLELPARPGAALQPGRPNPFRGEASIDYTVSDCGPVTLRVFDVAGRAVRDLVRSEAEPGAYTARWDGRDHSGRVVAPGLYLARLETTRGVESERMVRLE